MNFRTDLALEARELSGTQTLDGVESEEKRVGVATVTRIRITNENGAKQLGKPAGHYITVEVPPFSDAAEELDERLDAVADELSALLPKEGTVLVAGLGNSSITPDALGPKSISYVLATRHIGEEIARSAGLYPLRAVTAIAPGVLGQTGIETGELIKSLVDSIRPTAVIAIDALASMKLSRLGCTVQISDTGISPGAGVGNRRMQLNQETLGVPVIAMGVPTVVDAATLVGDLAETAGVAGKELDQLYEAVQPRGAGMVVTPREIDLLIERASKLVALAINKALQPHIAPEDILALVS